MHNTFHSYSKPRLLRRLGAALRAFLPRSRAEVGDGPYRWRQASERVHVIDDSNGNTTLIGIFGHVDVHVASALHAELERVPLGRRIHLDLSGACLESAHAVDVMQRICDDLEMHGARLRVSGLAHDHDHR